MKYSRLRKRSKTEDISRIIVQAHKKFRDKVIKNPLCYFGEIKPLALLKKNEKIHKITKEK